MTTDAPEAQEGAQPPRARGAARFSVRAARGGSALATFRHAGSLRAVFPRVRPGAAVEAVLVNTAGGVTGGDRFSVEAAAEAGAALTLSTQACERAYRAPPGPPGRLSVRLSAEAGARLAWLPQETILYDGAALERRLEIDLAPGARLLMCEPLIFGRAAMGERLTSGRFRDHVTITRDGQPIYRDGVHLSGDIAATLARPGVARGAGAMAALVLVAETAEAALPQVRALLPEAGGASLLAPDVLALRLLAPDGEGLRRALLPILDLLTDDSLPRAWRL
ncbi:urease accessory protein UreD [Rhodosalinus sediminis]|uniref:urease accessory protein UreD n=1 Tax=Rhodosalinus sediminis TaxID=1940533 RepID=UPI0023554582|nr:urease accessory protein UreD [Rhodosalinus sediminis]